MPRAASYLFRRYILEPSALATEYASQQSSLLALLEALNSAGLTENVDGIRLDELSYLKMDYIGRFTVWINSQKIRT